MNNKIRQLIGSGVPFLVLGIAIAFVFSLLIFFSYILVWGFIIGGTLALAAWIKNYFFPPKTEKKPHKGRVIEHDDNK